MLKKLQVQTKQTLEQIERFKMAPQWSLAECKEETMNMDTPELSDIPNIVLLIQTYHFQCRSNGVIIELRWIGDHIIQVQTQTSGAEMKTYLNHTADNVYQQSSTLKEEVSNTQYVLNMLMNFSKAV